MLDAVEEAFDQIALPVEPGREGEALFAVGARRDIGPGVLAGGDFPDGVAVVALVGQQRGALGHGVEQGLGFLAVVDLTAGQSQGNGTAISVNEGMDLAREAASRTSHATISGSPFFPVAPCW